MTEANAAWQQAIEQALASIAPGWPLDGMVASSPYWGLRAQSFQQAADTLHRVADSRLHLPLHDYLDAWQHGEISPDGLATALREAGWRDGVPAWLAGESNAPQAAPQLLTAHRREAAGPLCAQSWTEVVVQQISQCCAAWFDQDQADWHPARASGLYASWRALLCQARGLGALPVRRLAGALPEDCDAMLAAGLARLQARPDWLVAWLHALLMRNNGWAAWCAYLGWQAGQQGRTDPHLRQLLAIQLAWECVLDDGERAADSAWAAWQHDWARASRCRADRRALVWQRAHELSLHRPLLHALCRSAARGDDTRPALHAVFCIDVRSEPLRRAMEDTVPGCRTAGFAGFFGLPLGYRLPGALPAQPRLPGLLAPEWEVQAPAEAEPALSPRGWRAFQRSPLSAFALVECAGLGKLASLLRHSRARSRQAGLAQIDPWLTPQSAGAVPQDRLGPEKRTAIAGDVLAAMGLGAPLAPWVMLVGHASHVSNNPQAAALQCGACGGHGGHQHVRLLASWLNDPALRARLAAAGRPVPADTVFLPALHLTHSDEILLLDTDTLPAAARARLQALQHALPAASALARRRRAPQLGLEAMADDAALLTALRQKGDDWAETRPEWGLAGNALFIAAPRARTRRLDLAGRAFLHEYDWRSDADGSRLQRILSAPVLVAHWINMQYFASTVDPLHFGSGNKLLHNVVGGRIGVFEGNSGDLRIGLSWQSVHDGRRLRHAPLRLAVCIDAPPGLLAGALAAQPLPRQLAENGWLHLYCVHGEQPLRWQASGGWRPD